MRYRWWLCALWGVICLAFLVFLFVTIPGWDADSGSDWTFSGTETFVVFLFAVWLVYGVGFLVIWVAASFASWLRKPRVKR